MERLTVACVLRSGGEYTPCHVSALRDQVAEHLPGVSFVCLSDVPVDCERIPLERGYRGWWPKMELFTSIIRGDILYFDLDTVIVGSLQEIASVKELTLLSDFYKPHLAQSGMMFLPAYLRLLIWEGFEEDPHGFMRQFRGDGEYLNAACGAFADRWQDVCPNQIFSYKAHVRGKYIPPDARVICFHGRPRPWDCGEAWATVNYQRAA